MGSGGFLGGVVAVARTLLTALARAQEVAFFREKGKEKMGKIPD